MLKIEFNVGMVIEDDLSDSRIEKILDLEQNLPDGSESGAIEICGSFFLLPIATIAVTDPDLYDRIRKYLTENFYDGGLLICREDLESPNLVETIRLRD